MCQDLHRALWIPQPHQCFPTLCPGTARLCPPPDQCGTTSTTWRRLCQACHSLCQLTWPLCQEVAVGAEAALQGGTSPGPGWAELVVKCCQPHHVFYVVPGMKVVSTDTCGCPARGDLLIARHSPAQAAQDSGRVPIPGGVSGLWRCAEGPGWWCPGRDWSVIGLHGLEGLFPLERCCHSPLLWLRRALPSGRSSLGASPTWRPHPLAALTLQTQKHCPGRSLPADISLHSSQCLSGPCPRDGQPETRGPGEEKVGTARGVG